MIPTALQKGRPQGRGIFRADGGGVPDVDVVVGNVGAAASTQQNSQSGFGMTGDLPNGAEHSNQALQYPGEAVGAAIGSLWGMPGLGMAAGKNAGLTIGDALGGNTKGLGWDLSSNLPTGMQATGVGGILNTATGLPIHQWTGLKRGGVPRRDDGGTVGSVGGIAPTSGSENPTSQSLIQRYSNMPTEQLQELVGRLGGSQQGQVVQKILQQRLTQTAQNQNGQTAQSGAGYSLPAVPAMDTSAMRKGGEIEKRQSGGVSGGGGLPGSSGLLHSSVAGRTDQLQVTAPSGSYVIPADIVSGIGEGNTLAGARILQQAFGGSSPYGTATPKEPLRNTIPRASGGRAEHSQKPVLILGAGGEFLVHPKDVLKLGKGNMKRGHAILDKWVVKARKDIAKEMLKLPGPVKS